MYNTSMSVSTSFFNRQNGPLFSYFHDIRRGFERKLKLIVIKQRTEYKVEPIHYIVSQSSPSDLVPKK